MEDLLDSEENSEPVLAVVPFEAKPVEEVEPSPKEPQESLAKAHDRVVPVAPAVAAPAIFQKILDRHGNTLVSAKQCLAPTGASSTLSSDEELFGDGYGTCSEAMFGVAQGEEKN